MTRVAIIGGSGLHEPEGVQWRREVAPQTQYGQASSPLLVGRSDGAEVVFLARHGSQHGIAPHLINYRANIATLKAYQVTHVIAVNAVGGLTETMAPARLVVPDQIIDYSYGRENSFFDGVDSTLRHVDFTWPYSGRLRDALLQAASVEGITCIDGGVYGCTQGPRLETGAEVRRCRRDGCDVLGMTGMPEAVLARELDLEYASLCLVVNPGAGLNPQPISMAAIQDIVAAGAQQLTRVLLCAIKILQQQSGST